MRGSDENLELEADNWEEEVSHEETTPEKLMLAEIQERYDLKREGVYKRLRYLGIKPKKQGTRSYLNSEQIAQMDALHIYVQANGTFDGFLSDADLDGIDRAGIDEEEEGAIVQSAASMQQHRERLNPTTSRANLTGMVSNLDQIKVTARLGAKERLIAKALAEELSENPEMMPEEDLAEVEAVKAQFSAMFPKKRYSPEQLAHLLVEL